jgi:hypothetical protein
VAALSTALYAFGLLHDVSHLEDGCPHPSEKGGTTTEVRVSVALPLLRRKVTGLTCCGNSHPYRPLYLCFSGFALCLYSWSNFIQRSTFAKREPKPPSNLIQIQGWLGPVIFFNPDTNESMRVGYERMPEGSRIHPAQHNNLAIQTTGELPLRSCQSHLGHLGHSFIASRRYIPALCRTSIILLISIYYHKGTRDLVSDYTPTLPANLPLKELTRLMGKQLAITKATSIFVLWSYPIRLLVLSYTMHAIGELVYEQVTSLRNISGVAAAHVSDITQQIEQAT